MHVVPVTYGATCLKLVLHAEKLVLNKISRARASCNHCIEECVDVGCEDMVTSARSGADTDQLKPGKNKPKYPD